MSCLFIGGWWYKTCRLANLNGLYLRARESRFDGVTWFEFKGNFYSLKFTEMKIRPTR